MHRDNYSHVNTSSSRLTTHLTYSEVARTEVMRPLAQAMSLINTGKANWRDLIEELNVGVTGGTHKLRRTE